MTPFSLSFGRKAFGALLCAAMFALCGCHHTGNTSFYGIAWVTLTSESGGVSNVMGNPADFTSYVINVDSITLTRSDGVVVTALNSPVTVDLTQVQNISEMWGSATVPDGTYTAATVTLDYTNAVITVDVNGVPTLATVQDTNGAAVTTLSESVTFPTTGQLVVSPTYASTSAERLAIKLDLAASGDVNTSGTKPVVTVAPFLTVAVQPSDTKLIRIRGPLINSNVGLGTYTVYMRPFYDEVYNLGTLSLFSTANTLYTINGQSYTGLSGITALSQLSAGSTITAAYTTFTPSVDPLNHAPAGTFYPVYVVAGSTLEDNYTEGISGDVIARNGNTLTLRGSTLILNTADTFTFEVPDTQVLLGAGTLVTADGIGSVAGLNADSIAVGQHIQVRGIYSVLPSGVIQLDATGTSSTNTGSVRLQATQLWGSLTAVGGGSLTMNVATINDWPVSIFNFAGNGTSAAATPTASAFTVATGSLALPAGVVAGNPLWVNGIVAPFGTAPPDFNALAVNSQSSVQVAGGSLTPPGTQSCGLGSQVCQPASLQIKYLFTTGTSVPFLNLSNAGFSVNLANPALDNAIIRIGPETIDLNTLPAALQVVPTSLPVTTTFSPQFAVGNPTTATVTPTVTAATTSILVYSNFADFVTEFNALVGGNPVKQIDARGVYDPSSNTFTATSVNAVL